MKLDSSAGYIAPNETPIDPIKIEINDIDHQVKYLFSLSRIAGKINSIPRDEKNRKKTP